MARRSQYEFFKPKILAEFAKGRTPKDVYSDFPDVPRTTVRDWYAEFVLRNSAKNSAKNSAQVPPGAENQGDDDALESSFSGESDATPVKVIELVSADDTELPDLSRIKRELWRHIRKPRRESAVVAQLANAYMRAIEIENKINSGNETSGDATNDEARISRVAQILDAARARRDGQANRAGQGD